MLVYAAFCHVSGSQNRSAGSPPAKGESSSCAGRPQSSLMSNDTVTCQRSQSVHKNVILDSYIDTTDILRLSQDPHIPCYSPVRVSLDSLDTIDILVLLRIHTRFGAAIQATPERYTLEVDWCRRESVLRLERSSDVLSIADIQCAVH